MVNSSWTSENRLQEHAAARRKPYLQRYVLLHQMLAWVVLVLVALFVAEGMQHLRQNTTAGLQAQAEIDAIQSLYLAVVDQETGLRGYLLTQDQHFLEPYYTGEQEFLRHVTSLQVLLRASSDHSLTVRLATLIKLDKQHQLWNETYAKPQIQLARDGRLSTAHQIVRSGQGKQQMDQMRVLLETWLHSQRAKQTALSQATLVTLTQVRQSALAGLLIVLLVSILASTRAAHAISQGLWRVTAAARRVASGSLNERVPIAHIRESALLAVTFNEMSDQLQQREADLQASSSFNRMILESVADGVIGVDTRGNITFVNSAALALTGFSQDDLAGKNKHERLHHTRVDGLKYAENQCPIRHSLLGGETLFVTGEVFWRKDGTSFPVEYQTAPLQNSNDEITGAVVTFRDVSVREQAEQIRKQNEAQLRAMVSSLPIGVVVLNKAGSYILSEGRQITELGISSDLVGHNIYERFADTPIAIEYFERALQGEKVRITTQRGERDFEIQFIPMITSDLEIIGVIGVTADITDILQAEKELREINTELTHSNMDLEQFMYIASHDLQTPLRTIISFTELLSKQLGGHLDENAKIYMNYILSGAAQMKRLIDDVVTYSRIDRAEYEFQLTNLEDVISHAKEELEAVVKQVQAIITSDPLPSLNTNYTDIGILFYNLIENAIKYRSPDRPPRIHIGVIKERQSWHFKVEDNGIGIEPQYFERIFRMFQRLQPRELYSETGIGLTVCKKIVERHKGQIWVESVPDVGSTFHFTIPER